MLEERLRLMRIEKYGAGGEKLSQVQMQLFELEPVARGSNSHATYAAACPSGEAFRYQRLCLVLARLIGAATVADLVARCRLGTAPIRRRIPIRRRKMKRLRTRPSSTDQLDRVPIVRLATTRRRLPGFALRP